MQEQEITNKLGQISIVPSSETSGTSQKSTDKGLGETDTIENRLLMLADMPSESSGEMNSYRLPQQEKNDTPGFTDQQADENETQRSSEHNQYEFLEKIQEESYYTSEPNSEEENQYDQVQKLLQQNEAKSNEQLKKLMEFQESMKNSSTEQVTDRSERNEKLHTVQDDNCVVLHFDAHHSQKYLSQTQGPHTKSAAQANSITSGQVVSFALSGTSNANDTIDLELSSERQPRDFQKTIQSYEKNDSPEFTPYAKVDRNSMDDSSKKADLHVSFQNSLTDFLLVEKNQNQRHSRESSEILKNGSISHFQSKKHSKNSSVGTKSDVTPRQFINSEPLSSDYQHLSDEKKKYHSFGMKPAPLQSQQEETIILNEQFTEQKSRLLRSQEDHNQEPFRMTTTDYHSKSLPQEQIQYNSSQASLRTQEFNQIDNNQKLFEIIEQIHQTQLMFIDKQFIIYGEQNYIDIEKYSNAENTPVSLIDILIDLTNQHTWLSENIIQLVDDNAEKDQINLEKDSIIEGKDSIIEGQAKQIQEYEQKRDQVLHKMNTYNFYQAKIEDTIKEIKEKDEKDKAKIKKEVSILQEKLSKSDKMLQKQKMSNEQAIIEREYAQKQLKKSQEEVERLKERVEAMTRGQEQHNKQMDEMQRLVNSKEIRINQMKQSVEKIRESYEEKMQQVLNEKARLEEELVNRESIETQNQILRALEGVVNNDGQSTTYNRNSSNGMLRIQSQSTMRGSHEGYGKMFQYQANDQNVICGGYDLGQDDGIDVIHEESFVESSSVKNNQKAPRQYYYPGQEISVYQESQPAMMCGSSQHTMMSQIGNNANNVMSEPELKFENQTARSMWNNSTKRVDQNNTEHTPNESRIMSKPLQMARSSSIFAQSQGTESNLSTRLEINLFGMPQNAPAKPPVKNRRSKSIVLNSQDEDNQSLRIAQFEQQAVYTQQSDLLNQHLCVVSQNEQILRQFSYKEKQLSKSYKKLIKDQDQKIAEMEKQYIEHVDKIQSLLEQIQKANNNVSSKESEIQRMKVSALEQSTKITQLEKEKKEMAELQEQIKLLNQERYDLNELNQKLQKELEKAQKQVKNSEKELKELAKSNDVFQEAIIDELNKLNEQIAKNKKIKKTKQKKQDQEKKMLSLLSQIQNSISENPKVVVQDKVRSYHADEPVYRSTSDGRNNSIDNSLSIKKYGIRETGRFVNNSPVPVYDVNPNVMSRTAPIEPVYQINLQDQRSRDYSQTRVPYPPFALNNWSTGSPKSYSGSQVPTCIHNDYSSTLNSNHAREKTFHQFDHELPQAKATSASSLEGPLHNYKSVSPRVHNRTFDNASSLTIKRSPSYYQQEIATKRNHHGVDVMDLIIETLSQSSIPKEYQQRDPSTQTEHQFNGYQRPPIQNTLNTKYQFSSGTLPHQSQSTIRSPSGHNQELQSYYGKFAQQRNSAQNLKPQNVVTDDYSKSIRQTRTTAASCALRSPRSSHQIIRDVCSGITSTKNFSAYQMH